MDLRKGKYILPNIFTLASIFFGFLAIVSSYNDDFKQAAIALIIAIIADSLDGRVARMTKTETRFGVQLDSLADVVSFGVAPAILTYSFSLRFVDTHIDLMGSVLSFIYISAGAMRLARFNLIAEQGKKTSPFFVGLPIPGAAAILSLMIWVMVDANISGESGIILFSLLMPTLSALMISKIRYRNFKHMHISMLGRILLFAIIGIFILLAFRSGASFVLFAIALAYVCLGPIEWMVRLIIRRPHVEENPTK